MFESRLNIKHEWSEGKSVEDIRENTWLVWYNSSKVENGTGPGKPGGTNCNFLTLLKKR